jgi:hypothetical protein
MQQGSNAGGAATLTDEQILGMDEGAAAGGSSAASLVNEAAGRSSGASAEPGLVDQSGLAFGDVLSEPRAGSSDGSGQPDAARNGDVASGRGAAEPAWLAALETQPGAAAEARRWRDAAKDISSIDAAYFSGEPGARSGLAERLYQSDPAAFRAMLAESARMLAARDPQGLAELARQLGIPEAAAPLRPRSVSQAARPATEPGAGATLVRETPQPNPQQSTTPSAQADLRPNEQSNNGSSGRSAFPAEAYRAFESSTNEDVGRRMHEAIDRTLASTLPEGIGEGARRRIGEDVFREVHASLASDRELSRRVGETLRDWKFDAAARQQVVALVSGRARAVLPEVARRVVAEWTSSVLASDRAKMARIDSAAARRDITGGRLPEPVAASALRPRDVDYRRLSDEQILEM